MSKQELIVGYDLCADYSQVSYYNQEKSEPDSVSLDGRMQIPTVLCRLFADGSWLAGYKAEEAAGEGRGALIRGFTENIGNDPLVDVAGERMEKSELIYLFVSKCLDALENIVPGAAIGFLTLTMETINMASADALKSVGRRLGLSAERFAIQSHLLSYAYYALSQRRDLWTHDVGLFEYDRRGLRYHHLSVSWKHHPASVTSESTDLTGYLDGTELEQPVGPELDRRFVEAIKEVSARRTISTYYLVGAGFEDVNEGSGWMNVSLQQLCAMRRHVFVGQNLYARGACYSSFYRAAGRRPDFVAVNGELLTKEVYIRSIHRNTPRRVVLAAAGTPWYGADKESYVIINACEQLVLHVRDTVGNLEHTVALPLPDLPTRPPKTTKLKIQTTFESARICHVRVTDMGFGELFAATGKIWEMAFDIDEISDVPGADESGAVIEATVPAEAVPLDMRMSGVRIFTLEELCWYLSENIYVITMDLFDDNLFYWMDKVTGSHTFALAFINFRESGKSLKEMVRFLMNSVDYLNNAEIAAVYNNLTMMEKQNPVEQARMAADNYYRFGHYMAALKIYHHVTYQMNHDFAGEVTRQFKAASWHNMGMTFLKLHNVRSAADCMQKAFETQREQSYLEAYICTLLLLGAQEKILEVTRRENVSQSLIDDLSARCQKAEAEWENSERGRQMQAGLELKRKQCFEEYSRYVADYLDKQKKRYELPQ